MAMGAVSTVGVNCCGISIELNLGKEDGSIGWFQGGIGKENQDWGWEKGYGSIGGDCHVGGGCVLDE
jgi:hypothetical protein